MREIKFRGRKYDSQDWVVGKLCYNNVIKVTTRFYRVGGYSHDVTEDIKVDPKTVGQYTGKTDKNETEIYEGDIANCIPFDEREIHMSGIRKVIWYEDHATFYYDSFIPMHWSGIKSYEIIGNIHDNPKLLDIQ